ncbi:putative reverse transcriptase domain-containing protein [Tanacetum coccineum]
MWLGLTLSGLVKRKSILGLYHCAPSATIITMGCVLLSAQTAKELGIWPEIVEVLLMLTTKELLGKYRRLLHVLNVEFKGTTRRICLKLKNKNYRNRSGNSKAHRRACALGGNNANPDLNVVTGTFLLNNRYASILFDTGADRSFVSTTFSSFINITPTTLDIIMTLS